MRNSFKAAVVAALLLAASVARAQVVPAFDLERLSLDPSAVSSMVIGTGETRPAGEARLSLAGHWEQRPLVLLTDGDVVGRGIPYDRTRVGDIVDNRVTAHLGASVSLHDRFELNFRLPLVAWQDGDKGLAGVPRVEKTGMGTPTFGFRWQVLNQSDGAVNVALAADALIPFGNQKALAGNEQWLFTPRVEFGHRFEKFVVGAQAGALIRERDLNIGNGRTLPTEAQGGVVVATTGQLRGELSVRGAYADYKNERSMETLAGVRYAMADWEAFALGGPGFFEAPGTPKWRAVVGLAYVAKKPPPPPPPPPPVVKVDPCAAGQTHTPDQCPDLDDDGDGIKNKDDACPTVAGIPELKGCPDKDTDGDGVPDRLDKCPNEPGPKENGGCPDTDKDGDGIPDRLDKCPDVPGTAEYNGCPPPKARVNVETKKIDILEKVYFDVNKATIQERSYGLLDEVAKVLEEHKEITKVLVEGHTDNTGAADYNKYLSGERAKAVKAYLVKKGVDAGRLDSKGFGQEKPVADNKTKEGREQNRRVEFTIQ
ncbi:MAG TPA: OmpA family protein [Anaeromyxobacteraceae bacterium]|nr:OmpA family protein [Anaeromyxobacteraceae bacterium]